MIVLLRDVDMKKPVQSKKLKQNNNLDGLKKEDKEALGYMKKEFGELLKKYNKNNNKKKQITKLFAITYDVGKKTKNDELYASYDFAGTSESNGQYQIGKGGNQLWVNSLRNY